MKHLLLVLSLLHLSLASSAQNTRFLTSLFKENNLHFDHTNEVQVFYTEINRKKNNEVHFKSFSYNYNPNTFFFPGSALGLPMASLALENFNLLNKPYLTKNINIRFLASGLEPELFTDSTSKTQSVFLAHLINKMMYANDASAYDRIYDILGQAYVNQRFHSLGFTDTWFLHRLSVPENQESARTSGSVLFYRNDLISYYSDIIYMKRWPVKIEYYVIHELPKRYNTIDFFAQQPLLNYAQASRSTLPADQLSLGDLNKTSIQTLHMFMKKIIFPPKKDTLQLSKADYLCLYKSLALSSKDSVFAPQYTPQLTSRIHPDLANKNLQVFSNSSEAMGFLVENAYIIDHQTKLEYLVSIVVNCNKGSVMNNNVDYKQGELIIKRINNLLYQHEKNRKRKYLADFIFLKE